MVLSRIHMSSENITNRTLAFLTENYPSYVKVVPKEVLAFGLPSTSVSLLTSCYIFLLSLTSLSGNFLMIFLYIRHKTLRTASNKLVINLAFSNAIMHIKSWVIIVNGLHGGPILGDFGCFAFGGLGTIAGLSEIWTITCITYERYRAISTPLTKARRLSSLHINLMICGLWLAAGFFSLLPLCGIDTLSYVSESYYLACTFNAWSRNLIDQLYIYAMILTAWLIPICVILFCYIKIYIYTSGTRSSIKNLQKINGHQMQVRIHHHSSSKTHIKFNHQEISFVERKLAMRLLGIIIIWILGWTPYAFVAFMQLIGYGNTISKYFSLFSMLICKSSSVLNAYIYGMRLPKFRKKIRPLLFCFFNRQEDCLDEPLGTYQVSRGIHVQARITTNSIGDKIISCKKLVKTKTWHSDFNLWKNTPSSDFDSWGTGTNSNSNNTNKKICPKSRIKRRAVLLKGTSIVVTKAQCKSYMVNGNSQFLDKRRWSL